MVNNYGANVASERTWGFESLCFCKFLGGYTVGVAGLTVDQLSKGSGGSTPSLPTILRLHNLIGKIVDF